MKDSTFLILFFLASPIIWGPLAYFVATLFFK